MRRLEMLITIGVTWVILLLASPVNAADNQSVFSEPDSASWTLVFEDGFNLTHTISEDNKTYKIKDQPVWTNMGSMTLQDCGYITSEDNGVLNLYPQERPEDALGNSSWQCRLTSTAQFGAGPDIGATYIFAARMVAHSSTGHLSSFWVTGTKDGVVNEIDVIENSGTKANGNCVGSSELETNISDYFGFNHAFYSAYKPSKGKKYCLGKATSDALHDDAYHTFSAEWAPGKYIKFFIDGTETASFGPQYAKNIPVNLILTNINKANIDKRNHNNFLKVQWVKVWKKNGSATPPLPPVCENDCWRAVLGVSSFTISPPSNPADIRLNPIFFNRVFYYNIYPDVQQWAQQKVASQGGTVYQHAEWHWLNYGIPQGRMGAPTFHPIAYMNLNPDVSAAYGWNNYLGAISHYFQFGRNEGRTASVFFNVGHYKSRYGDLSAYSNADALTHFIYYGINEGRQGSADFAPAWYLGVYLDVRNVWGNNYRGAMINWLLGGQSRLGRP